MKKVASTKFSIIFLRKIVLALLLAVVLWGGGTDSNSLRAQGIPGYIPTDSQGNNLGVAGRIEEESESDGKTGNSKRTVTVTTPEEKRDKCKASGYTEGTPEHRNCVNQLIANENPTPSPWDFFKIWGEKAVGVFADGLAKTVATVLGIFLQLIWIPVMSVLFRISGYLLDISVIFTLNSSYLGGLDPNIPSVGPAIKIAIETVWVMVRNTFNITFIFILLYTAIKTIIGSAGTNTKKTIANVVVAALLINFSLFISRVLIDAGNLVAVTFYDSIKSLSTDPAAGVGTQIMQALGMTKWWDFGGASVNGITTGLFIISSLQLITLMTGFIVFMYATLLMITRIVALIFLMATSPIGFIGDILPSVSEYSKMWRTNLFGQITVAPIFLLFVYLILQVASTLSGASIPKDFTGKASEGDYIIYFKYVLVIMLLVIAVKVTKKASGVVGGAVEKLGTWAAGAAIGVATGGAAFLGRATVGKMATSIADSKTLKETGKERSLAGFAARRALSLSDKTSKASFDVRNTSGFKKTTGAIGDYTGLGVDYSGGMEIKKGGYTGWLEERQKNTERMIKLLGTNSKEGEAKEQLDMYKEFSKINTERKRKDDEVTEAMNTIQSLLQDEVTRGVDNSDRIIPLRDKVAAAQDRKKEIDDRVKEIKNNYRDNFSADITTLTTAQVTAMGDAVKAAQKRQKDYLSGYQKPIIGRLEGVTMTVNEKRKISRKIRDDINKKVTDVDKIIKGITSATPPAAGGAPCWVAEVLYGIDSPKTHTARLWAATNDNWFTKLYREKGQVWAKWLTINIWAQPIIKPIWDLMAIKGQTQASRIKIYGDSVEEKFKHLVQKVK